MNAAKLQDRFSMIGLMLDDYRKELEALQPEELQNQFDMMKHIKDMSDDEWKQLQQASKREF